MSTKREKLTELEYLTAFYHAADFGPADGDVRDMIRELIMSETGKDLPDGWDYYSDGATRTFTYWERART